MIIISAKLREKNHIKVGIKNPQIYHTGGSHKIAAPRLQRGAASRYEGMKKVYP